MTLSSSTCRCSLRRQLKSIHHKIARGEEEIAEAQGGSRSNPGLFEQEHAGLRSLRDRLDQLKGIERGLRKELRALK